MRSEIAVINISDSVIQIENLIFPSWEEVIFTIELTSIQFQKIRAEKNLKVGAPGKLMKFKIKDTEIKKTQIEEVFENAGITKEIERIKIEGGSGMRRITVFNKVHFPIEVRGFMFPPGEEIGIDIELTSSRFRDIRANKSLRVGKHNNAEYKKKHMTEKSYQFNVVYDVYSQHRGNAYIRAIESLANPIMKHLPKNATGFVNMPTVGYNLRFFSEMRINQQGKYPVGPYDIFMSHGIGDKDYWIASRIAKYKHALVPGPAWEKKIKAGKYKGEIHVVGYTKLDPLFNGEYAREKRKKSYIVWAPTHGYPGKHKGRSSYPQCMSLINEIPNCYEKTISLHPTSRISRKNKQDISMQELLDADVIIADAGSTLYEAWALGKPVIFPDWICKNDVMAHFRPGNLEYQIYDKKIGYHAKDMKHLIKLIDVALNKGMQDAEIEFIENVFPSELRGKAGENSAKVLMKIAKG